jgi:hypothetical protein
MMPELAQQRPTKRLILKALRRKITPARKQGTAGFLVLERGISQAGIHFIQISLKRNIHESIGCS